MARFSMDSTVFLITGKSVQTFIAIRLLSVLYGVNVPPDLDPTVRLRRFAVFCYSNDAFS